MIGAVDAFVGLLLACISALFCVLHSIVGLHRVDAPLLSRSSAVMTWSSIAKTVSDSMITCAGLLFPRGMAPADLLRNRCTGFGHVTHAAPARGNAYR